jgi:hypothetical protein
MTARMLDGLGWAEMKARLTMYPESVAVAWAALRNGEGDLLPLAVSVRGGVVVNPRFLTYQRMQLGCDMYFASQAALLIQNGRWLPKSTAPVPQPDAGTVYQITGGQDFGLLPPKAIASIYYTWNWDHSASMSAATLDEPLGAAAQPWYPTANDAVLELLYGRTRTRQRLDLSNRMVIDLPYGTAFLRSPHLDRSGCAFVDVAEAQAGAAAEHTLHVTWQLHPSSAVLRRWETALSNLGPHTIDMGGVPVFWSVALLDRSGMIVDSFEQTIPRRPSDPSVPLPVLAIPEALDSLDAALRLLFRAPLFHRPQLTSVAETSLSALNREDLIARLSGVATVLDAASVDGALLQSDEAKVKGSLLRMRLALNSRLDEDLKDPVDDAIDQLRAVIDLRTAFQHKVLSRGRDLETACARLQLDFPLNPPDAWESIRHTITKSVSTIRQALRAQADST